ncbi:MAG TPA: alkaline phosphatase [Sedimentisphaerales bacterium]|jgi:alkaline phosphatase|nr:alkaline phosphatase [Sedimentisphaerales bacterium]HNU31848.1 alkaline phosphatase [Sedimentisphaerales bacterium]
MRRTVFAVCVSLFAAGMASAQVAALNGQPKYVFYFIGDGMGFTQVHSAEAYLATTQSGDTDSNDVSKSIRLVMTGELPYTGFCTTYDFGRLITDSASAGTAMACGHKTYDGVIAMDPSKTISYKSVAKAAKEKGMKVGILTSVSLDHATPAVFYANIDTRNKYFHIASQAAASGFDFFGGGSFKYTDGYTGKDAAKWPELAEGEPNAVNIWTQFQNNGYTVVHTLAELQALPAGAKCVAASDNTQDSAAMHYEIDRAASGEWSLAEVTAEAIRMLDNPNGFFMMLEGGKIDWTCHANDARTSIDDTIAFDNAVAEAVKFAADHPGEVLIIVTADHETGGLTQGWAGTQYGSGYQNLMGQTMSFQAFSDWLKEYQADPSSLWNWISVFLAVFGPEDADIRELDLMDDEILVAKIKEAFGLDYAALTDVQKAQLEEAYDRQMTGELTRGTEEDYLMFGGYQPLAVTCTHLTNARAGLGWTSYSHTAVPVPVMSNDARFSGYYDNTDLSKKVAEIMGVSLD